MSDADALSSSTPAASDDWAAKATTTVVGYVDTVRTATTGKALVASRALVYFLVAGLAAMVALIIGLVLLVRLVTSFTAFLPFIDDGEVWLAYLILGSIFTLAGMFLWKKKGI